ncbi:MAG: TetR/AcrR family transcriptional regulator [Pseudonocardiales bacterium]|nr:MAG: TetR/AcrR family transcriptional regulator [Pseudonocardiales bacterium]
MAGSTAANILAAARAIVVAEGSSGVTMRKVASAVSVTPMTIYRHYADRGDLLQAVAEAEFGALAEEWTLRRISASTDLDQLFADAVSELLDLALGRPRLYALLFTERRPRARTFPRDFRSGQSPTLTVVAEALQQGIRRGEYRAIDVWEQSLIIAAVLHGLIQLRDGDRIDLDESLFRSLCHKAVQTIVDGLRS